MEWSKRVSSAWPPQRINDNNENENDNEKGGNDKDHHYQHLQETWKGQERNQAVPLLQERTRYQRQSTMCSTGSGWSSTFERKNLLIFVSFRWQGRCPGCWWWTRRGCPSRPPWTAPPLPYMAEWWLLRFSIFSRFFPIVAKILRLFFICFWQ